MDLYKVIIADDEAHIREGISHTISWEALGFKLIGEAENGQEALEMAENLRPDLVLTDIQMPFLTGLELCEKLSLSLPTSKFVMFSGFDEFEYAQKAIHMKVFEYILKPINTLELTEILINVKKKLDQEREDKNNLENLKKLYEESLPILKEHFLVRLINGISNKEKLLNDAKSYGLNLDFDAFQVALISIEGGGENEIFALPIKELLKEQFIFENGEFHKFLYEEGIAILVCYKGEPSPYAIIDQLNKSSKMSKSLLGVEFTAGLGKIVPLDDIKLSTQGGKSALDYRVLQGIGRAIYIQDLEPKTIIEISFDKEDEQSLTSAVKLGHEQEIQRIMDSFLNKLETPFLSVEQNQMFRLEILASLLKLARSAGFDMQEIFGENFNSAVQVSEHRSNENVIRWLKKKSLKIQGLFAEARTNTASLTINKAYKFIAENYGMTNLSVEILCDHLFLSPSYFSTLFKKETDMSFTSYVTRLRMEKAGELLLHTDEKTYLIAEKVGFEDSNYFSYVFKKYFGMPPSKYRNSKR